MSDLKNIRTFSWGVVQHVTNMSGREKGRAESVVVGKREEGWSRLELKTDICHGQALTVDGWSGKKKCPGHRISSMIVDIWRPPASTVFQHLNIIRVYWVEGFFDGEDFCHCSRRWMAEEQMHTQDCKIRNPIRRGIRRVNWTTIDSSSGHEKMFYPVFVCWNNMIGYFLRSIDDSMVFRKPPSFILHPVLHPCFHRNTSIEIRINRKLRKFLHSPLKWVELIERPVCWQWRVVCGNGVWCAIGTRIAGPGNVFI